MNQAVHNKLVSFIWSAADDCLRDVYVRRKYPIKLKEVERLKEYKATLINAAIMGKMKVSE